MGVPHVLDGNSREIMKFNAAFSICFQSFPYFISLFYYISTIYGILLLIHNISNNTTIGKGTNGSLMYIKGK